jgi:3-hydroxyisobutyrate dehydrogenase-like beta-hydroxyacid dehydrogenase
MIYGYIGLGNLGSPSGASLIRNGSGIYDRDPPYQRSMWR